MLEMWYVQDVRCWGCGMFGMSDVLDVGCGMFAGMWDVDLKNALEKFKKMPNLKSNRQPDLTFDVIKDLSF